MSRCAQYYQDKEAIILMSQESSYPPNQTAFPLEAGFRAAIERTLEGTSRDTIVPSVGEEDVDASGRSNER